MFILKILLILCMGIPLLSCSSEEYTEIDISKYPEYINPYKQYSDSINQLPVFEDDFVYSFLKQTGIYGSSRAIYNEEIDIRSTSLLTFSNQKNSIPSDSKNSLQLLFTPFVFDETDKEIVTQQIKACSGKKWDLKKLGAQTETQARPFKDSVVWYFVKGKTLPDKNITYCYQTIGIPIFNKERNKAVQFYSYQCGGTLGSGSILYFELKDGKWNRVTSNQLYIS